MTAAPGHDMAADGYGSARASDADRERAIDVLKAAFAEGRLTGEEHGTRVQQVLSSRTYAELATLAADLPAGPLGTLSWYSPATHPAYLPVAAARRNNPLAVASLVCGLIPVLPATLAAIILGIQAHRQIQRTGERGAALATAGISLAALALLATLLWLLVGLR